MLLLIIIHYHSLFYIPGYFIWCLFILLLILVYYRNLFRVISFDGILYYCSLLFIHCNLFYCSRLFYLLSQVILCSFILLLLSNYHCNIFYLLFQIIWTNVNLYYCSLLLQFILFILSRLIYSMFLYTITYYYY